jgi:hypothetical protein
MKNLLFVLLMIIANGILAQNKHALIIAISDYPNETGWADLSCEKDVELVKPAYEKQGFKDIVILRDKEATREGIVEAFKALNMRCKPGDIVLIHYSGHGQQIFDDNGDEPDKLDEAIVAWGAPSEYENGYMGQKHLRDDEFGSLINNIRMRLTAKGNVLAVIDACHSGTASRGVAKKRGGKAPIIPPNFIAGNGNELGAGYNVSEPKSRGQAQSMSPMILFSASSFDEENSETYDDNGNGVGSLSYAVAKAFNSCGKDYTYRLLWSDVMSIMNEKVPHQTPMIEGDQDYALFGGAYVKQEPYYSIKDISNGIININAGSLMGITANSKIGLYHAGTIQTAGVKPIGHGIIIRVGAYASQIQLDDKNIILKKPADYWVFITEPALGKVLVNCSIEASSADIQGKIAEEIKKINIAQSDMNKPIDVIIKESGADIRVIRANDGMEYAVINKNSGDWMGEAMNYLKAFAQNKYLSDMNSGVSNQMKLQLVACDESGKPIAQKPADNMVAFAEGSQAIVRIKNNSAQRMYFNVIDIQPDGKINPVFPQANELTLKHAEQYVLEPGESKDLPPVSFSPPYGKEIFKVFASNEVFNLAPFIINNGQQTRGSNASVIEAFQRPEIQSRGANIKKSDVQELITSEFVFKINPK